MNKITLTRTDLLLHLEEQGIPIERVVMNGDIGFNHPKLGSFLEKPLHDFDGFLSEALKGVLDVYPSLEGGGDALGKTIIKDLFENYFDNKAFDLDRKLKTLEKAYDQLLTDYKLKVYPDAVHQRLHQLIDVIGTMLPKYKAAKALINEKTSYQHRAGSCFAEFYIPAFLDRSKYTENQSKQEILGAADKAIANNQIELQEDEKDSSHSKASFLDAIIFDRSFGCPGKIMLFDDRRACINTVGKRIGQYNERKLQGGNIEYVGVHLDAPKNDKNHMDNPQNRALISNVVSQHMHKIKFNLKAFRYELQEELNSSKREQMSLFGHSMGSSFAKEVLAGKITDTEEIIQHAKFHPFGTVRKALDKFDISDLEPKIENSSRMKRAYE